MATGGYHGDTSDEIFDFTCSPCAEQSKNREAVRYCVECQDYYCQACTDLHKMFPAMRGHKLLNKADFKASGQQASLPQVPTERCSVHKTKLIDMYCRDHDDVGCTSCMAEKHRSCEAVATVSDVVDKSGTRNDDDTLTRQLTSLIEVCRRIQSDKEKEITGADQAKAKAIEEIKKQRKKLDNDLDRLERASRQDIEREHKKLSAESEEVQQRAKKYETKLQKRVTALRSSKGNNAQLFVSEKLGQNYVSEIIDATNTISQVNKFILHFTGDSSIHQALLQYKSLGNVSNLVMSCADPGHKTTLYQVKKSYTFNVKLKEDKNMSDTISCCFISPEFLLVTDWKNASLKRVNMQKQFITDHCEMPANPESVCCVNTHEAAVSLDNKTIQFVSIRGHVKISRQVKFDHDCFGIACEGGKMYVTDANGTMYIHEISGRLVKTVKTDSLGNNIFALNRHVAYNTYNEKVYVADNSKGLVSFDKNGSYISSFTDKIQRAPCGVCTDGRGNVFVCALGSSNVIQIGSDGQLLDEIVSASNGLGNAWSVCFDQISKRLVVSAANGNDEIFIFDLE